MNTVSVLLSNVYRWSETKCAEDFDEDSHDPLQPARRPRHDDAHHDGDDGDDARVESHVEFC